MTHNSNDYVPVTFTALRERAFAARKVLAMQKALRGKPRPVLVNLSELAFVGAMALIQIAQELNEIKLAMNTPMHDLGKPSK